MQTVIAEGCVEKWGPPTFLAIRARNVGDVPILISPAMAGRQDRFAVKWRNRAFRGEK
jgi:hypothetical protein